ncbi:hypothetical protein EW145_g7992 [Phellinidium pouzarii]|uniref:EF-hand domain-containing protein n=1 Tax=Phellinidium pouzarii TaxID=167371 RepID=A0A4S4KB98_9AGAM|nr:hypothetical protein EW145_g7992 [Phellinidium pouzarii]
MSAYYNLFDSNDSSRVQSPRPETPEPYVAQGRRNAPAGVQLLDDEGAISEKFERCLKHIFAKYCTPKPSASPAPPSGYGHGASMPLLMPPVGAHLTPGALDQWATDTNGSPLPKEAKEELELLDVTDEGNLTFQGFLQIYQLQTENDEEETWRDLVRAVFTSFFLSSYLSDMPTSCGLWK